MGCGRSKHRSKDSSDDPDHELANGRAQKSTSKQDRSDHRENEDPARLQVGKMGGSKKEKVGPKMAETPQQRNSSATPGSANGIAPLSAQESMGGFRTDKYSDIRFAQEKKKTAFKDKALSGNSQNPQITASQLEFFRMLDERIEQGQDYEGDRN